MCSIGSDRWGRLGFALMIVMVLLTTGCPPHTPTPVALIHPQITE